MKPLYGYEPLRFEIVRCGALDEGGQESLKRGDEGIRALTPKELWAQGADT